MKSTLYNQIGNSNWYQRINARGKVVKRQLPKSRAAWRNNIIRARRTYEFEKRELGVEQVRELRKQQKYIEKLKHADELVFDTRRKSGTFIIYEKRKGKWVEKRRFDVDADDYFDVYKNSVFDPYYDKIKKGELKYKFVRA